MATTLCLSRALLARRAAAAVSRRSLASAATTTSNFSFASPESDFTSGALPHTSEWSGSLSFGSPESDFQYGALEKPDAEWSHGLSCASPEADFYQNAVEQQQREWSESLSFTSPEADYTARVDVLLADADSLSQPKEWSHDLTFATPDSDFCSTLPFQKPEPSKQDYVNHVVNDSHLRDSMAYSLSFASAESDFCNASLQDLMNDRMKQQLQVSENQLVMVDPTEIPLPRTLQEATSLQDAAVVLTKPVAPFEIVQVNDMWVGLCGYTQEEARHETLAMLQGPETSTEATKYLLDELVKGNDASTILTNYDKSGRKFHNRVQVGPIRDAHNVITHFVGILQEVQDMEDSFKKKTVQ